MKRLIAKPRPKKKQVGMSVKFWFEVYNDNENEAKLDCKRFKDWMQNSFCEWDESMLQYFLYGHNLVQGPDDDKYLMDVHIDKILVDDSATSQEVREFMNQTTDEEREEMEKDFFDFRVERDDKLKPNINMEELDEEEYI